MSITLPIKEINPSPRNQNLMYLIGLSALMLNKVRRTLKEYSTPRVFNLRYNIDESVNYVSRITRRWHEVARMYTQDDHPFLGKSILEIGPGPDLGTGIILLALGAKSYHAIDMFPLASLTPANFYDALFKAIANYPEASRAKEIFSKFQANGSHENFGYQIVKFPLITEVTVSKLDVIVSQAVWEHISDPETTLFNLSKFSNENGLFLNLVDFATHTRKIREMDPLNILRYDEKLYEGLAFPGTPNRWRCSDYLNLSKKLCLRDIRLVPTGRCSNEYVKAVSPHLAIPFQNKNADDLAILACFWLAKFP